MKISWPLALAILPAFLLFYGFHHNDNLGMFAGWGDGLGYILTAKGILLEMKNSASVGDALRVFYEMRSWKGSTISQLTAIFLFLGGMDVSQTLYLFNSFFLALFLVYLFLTFSLFLSPWCAGAATALVSTMHWLFALTLFFDTYLPFIAATTMAIFHLLKSDNFRQRNHSLIFGFAAAFCACLRPIETTLILVVPLLYYFFVGETFRQHRIRSITVLLLPTALTMIVAYATYFWRLSYPGIYALAIVVPVQFLPLILHKWCRFSKNLSYAFLIIIVPATIWWLPFSQALGVWAVAGIGSMETFHIFKLQTLKVFVQTYLGLGGLGFLALIGLLSFQFAKGKFRSYTEKQLILFAVYLGVFILFYLSSLPGQNIIYSIVIFVFLGIVALILTLKNSEANLTATIILLLLVVNQVSYIVSMMSGNERKDRLVSLMKMDEVTYARDFLPGEVSPGPIYFDNLLSLLSKETQKAFNIQILEKEGGPRNNRVKAHVFNFLAEDKKLPIKFNPLDEEIVVGWGCDKNFSCINEKLSATDYLMFEGFDMSKDPSKLFKQEKSCRLEFAGTINPILSERDWIGYQVYKRVCAKAP